MKKSRLLISIICILCAIGINVFMLTYRDTYKNTSQVLYLELNSEANAEVRLYYSNDGHFNEMAVLRAIYQADGKSDVIAIKLPLEYKSFKIEYANTDKVVDVKNAYVIADVQKVSMDVNRFKNNSVITQEEIMADIAVAHNRFQKVLGIILSIMADILCLLIIKFAPKVIDIVKEILSSKKLMLRLALNDFKSRFAGSYLGIVWAFVHPIVTIAVYWFVFQVGFRSTPVDNFPFVLWLSTGLIPWFFFSESWSSATSSMIEYSYLVKKVVFKIGILPIVKILSALFVHVFFVAFIMLLYVVNGYKPDLAWLQAIYYSFCMCMLVVGLSYLTCAVMVFFRDLSQIISIFIQIGNWVTPIMWSFTLLSPKIRWIMYINPMFYIVQGYREALINHVWFFEMPYQTTAFWLFVIAMIGFGMIIFNKLKIHFADVL